jgi:cation:H+ antiporter
VAVFSIIDKTPSISVGNLMGGSIVLTLLIVPLLAVLNKGIRFDDRTEKINFPLAYLVISLPVLVILDKTLSVVDAYILIFSVFVLAFTISAKNTLLEKLENVINHKKTNVYKESLKILIGVVLIVVSCKFIVDTTVVYTTKLAIPPFLVGVLMLAIGTNLPEITILIRSTLQKKKSIALGDYIGSAAVNTLTLGFLVLFNNASIPIDSGIKINLLILPLGAILFLIFTRNKLLDRKEGFLLLGLYFLFTLLELFA